MSKHPIIWFIRYIFKIKWDISFINNFLQWLLKKDISFRKKHILRKKYRWFTDKEIEISMRELDNKWLTKSQKTDVDTEIATNQDTFSKFNSCVLAYSNITANFTQQLWIGKILRKLKVF